MNNEMPSIVLFIQQAIANREEEIDRLRKALENLLTVPDRRLNKGGRQVPVSGEGAGESVGVLLMDSLRQNGSLSVKQIHQWVTAKGRMVKYHTVSSMVNYYLRQKYIKRVAPGTYAIDNDPHKNGAAPTPTLTNGAPVPKEMRSVLAGQK